MDCDRIGLYTDRTYVQIEPSPETQSGNDREQPSQWICSMLRADVGV